MMGEMLVRLGDESTGCVGGGVEYKLSYEYSIAVTVAAGEGEEGLGNRRLRRVGDGNTDGRDGGRE